VAAGLLSNLIYMGLHLVMNVSTEEQSWQAKKKDLNFWVPECEQ